MSAKGGEGPSGPRDGNHFSLPNSHFSLLHVWPWLASIGCGAMLALGFPPFKLGATAFFGLIPLLCAVWFTDGRARRPFLYGWVAGITFFAISMHWLGSLGTLYSTPLLHGIPLLLGLYLGLYFAFWAWFMAGIAAPSPESRKFATTMGNLRAGLLGASAWTALEWTRGWMLSGFGWNGLGVAIRDELSLIQIAELTGGTGISWLVAYLNIMALVIVRRIIGEIGPQFVRRIRWEFGISMALLMGVFAYGVRTTFAPQSPHAANLRVCAVQPNIPQTARFEADVEDEIFKRLDFYTGLALVSEPDLIIWPEAVTASGYWSDQGTYDFVQKHASSGAHALLLGSLEDEVGPGAYNSALLLQDRGQTEDSCRKIHLVPFGEYLPIRPLFEPVLGMLVPGDLLPGAEPKVMHLKKPEIALGVVICFEDTLGDLTRKFVACGAQALVNITNDGWFLTSAGADQHLANAVFRAVETRRPLIRCGNTGITCVVDPIGRITMRSPAHQQLLQQQSIDIPTGKQVTLYTRWGDWFPKTCSVATLAVLLTPLVGRWLRRKRAKA